MHSKVHYFGKPIHAAMIALPVGMYVGSVIFDLFYLFDDGEQDCSASPSTC